MASSLTVPLALQMMDCVMHWVTLGDPAGFRLLHALRWHHIAINLMVQYHEDEHAMAL